MGVLQTPDTSWPSASSLYLAFIFRVTMPGLCTAPDHTFSVSGFARETPVFTEAEDALLWQEIGGLSRRLGISEGFAPV